MTSLAGCVLPIGPRFEDPPAAENFAPSIMDTQPLQGSVVTAITSSQMFSADITDPNQDDLYVRWIGEYPPFSNISQRLADDQKFSPGASADALTPVSIVLSCLNPLARIPQHPITMLVSDRPFWDPADPDAPKDLESLMTGINHKLMAKSAEANWVLNLPCQ